ncbi:MAG TPA: metalloregulator ArsR/SmtB family transcription factor [Gammaproteobacteria bacterium]
MKKGGDEEDALLEEELALLCKALSHPARVHILRYLGQHQECFFGDLSAVLPLAPATVSQHVTILRDAGLIIGSPQQQRICYCVNQDRLARFKRLVAML